MVPDAGWGEKALIVDKVDPLDSLVPFRAEI
jgi:hypothetical protein